MGEEKSKNNVVLIVIIIILLIAVIGLCGYIFLNKDNSKSLDYNIENNNTNSKNVNDQQTDKTDTNTPETKTNSIIMFDGTKAINSNEKNYTLACEGNAGIWITVDSTQKVLTFSFTPTRVVEFYSLTWTSTRNDMTSSKLNFDNKIVDIFFGEMGQSSSGDTLFILLEDGTVEYIPIAHMFNNVQAEVVSYGKINGVSDINKFTLSSTSDGVTTLAIKNDGTFYDLWYSLKDTGNY